MHYASKELHDSPSFYKQKSRYYVWECILRMWDHGRRNIKLDQAEFVDMGCQFGWLAET